MLLARNLGHGKFEDVSPMAGQVFREAWVARGMAIGDVDNDGRVDAIVATNDGPAHLLHNETVTPNHWISFLLVGHKSNRDAIGAEVKVTTAEGYQVATVSTAGSYLSSNDKRVHFGLGRADKVQSVSVRWPSGISQTLHNLPLDRQVIIDESLSPEPKIESSNSER